MALQYVPTKLDPRVVEKVEKDVEKRVFPNRNEGINSILKKHYKIKDEGGGKK